MLPGEQLHHPQVPPQPRAHFQFVQSMPQLPLRPHDREAILMDPAFRSMDHYQLYASHHQPSMHTITAANPFTGPMSQSPMHGPQMMVPQHQMVSQARHLHPSVPSVVGPFSADHMRPRAGERIVDSLPTGMMPSETLMLCSMPVVDSQDLLMFSTPPAYEPSPAYHQQSMRMPMPGAPFQSSVAPLPAGMTSIDIATSSRSAQNAKSFLFMAKTELTSEEFRLFQDIVNQLKRAMTEVDFIGYVRKCIRLLGTRWSLVEGLRDFMPGHLRQLYTEIMIEMSIPAKDPDEQPLAIEAPPSAGPRSSVLLEQLKQTLSFNLYQALEESLQQFSSMRTVAEFDAVAKKWMEILGPNHALVEEIMQGAPSKLKERYIQLATEASSQGKDTSVKRHHLGASKPKKRRTSSPALSETSTGSQSQKDRAEHAGDSSAAKHRKRQKKSTPTPNENHSPSAPVSAPVEEEVAGIVPSVSLDPMAVALASARKKVADGILDVLQRAKVILSSDTVGLLHQHVLSLKTIRTPSEFDDAVKKSIALLVDATELTDSLAQCLPGPLHRRFKELMAESSSVPEPTPTPMEEQQQQIQDIAEAQEEPVIPQEPQSCVDQAPEPSPPEDQSEECHISCQAGPELEVKEEVAVMEPKVEVVEVPQEIEIPAPDANCTSLTPVEISSADSVAPEQRFLSAVGSILAARPKKCMAIALLINKLQHEHRKDFRRFVQPSAETYFAKHFALVTHGSSLFVRVDEKRTSSAGSEETTPQSTTMPTTLPS